MADEILPGADFRIPVHYRVGKSAGARHVEFIVGLDDPQVPRIRCVLNASLSLADQPSADFTVVYLP